MRPVTFQELTELPAGTIFARVQGHYSRGLYRKEKPDDPNITAQGIKVSKLTPTYNMQTQAFVLPEARSSLLLPRAEGKPEATFVVYEHRDVVALLGTLDAATTLNACVS